MAKVNVTMGSNDLGRSRRFYDAVMAVLGGVFEGAYLPDKFYYRLGDNVLVWVSKPFDGGAASVGNGSMVSFGCVDKAAVDAAYAAALAQGGRDEGAPGPRAHYGPDYYGAYVRDPEGHKLSFVVTGA